MGFGVWGALAIVDIPCHAMPYYGVRILRDFCKGVMSRPSRRGWLVKRFSPVHRGAWIYRG